MVQSRRWLVLILAMFLALGVTYSVVTPIFEAGDELWHYPFVQSLATGHELPIQDPNVKTLWEQEGGQPPLYYAISALATFWIDSRDLADRLWRNPEAKIGIPLAFGNKNMVVHTSAENFPWQNTTLAVHLIRFLSLILSACTVAFTYFFALEIGNAHDIAIHKTATRFPIQDSEVASGKNRPRNDIETRTLAAFAAAFVAFNPMFIFISASVNNDNLATMLATLSLLLLVQLVTRGATTWRFVILGIVLGLGALTKISNLGLLVVAAGVFANLLWREWHADKRGQAQENFRRLRSSAAFRVLWNSLACAGIVIVIAFWWYARNWMLYGDPSAFNVWVQIAGGRQTPVTVASLLGELQGFRISFWGNLGGVNLIAPSWVYSLLDVFSVLALVGLAIGFVRRQLPRLLALPTLWLGIIVLSLVRWTWLTMASQGRLIFPAISAVAVLLAWGLEQFRIRNSKFKILNLNYGLVSFLFVFSLLAPFTIIAPAYVYPAHIADESSVPHLVHLTFDQQAELVGYALPQRTIAPGAELPLTLYWRARVDQRRFFGEHCCVRCE